MRYAKGGIMKNKYYFTYGTSESFPYQNGWSVVMADSASEAVALFNLVHPPKHTVYPPGHGGIINCSSIYSEADFEQTAMYKNGDNFGAGCHEVIELTVNKTVS